jgi:hypothetical protein
MLFFCVLLRENVIDNGDRVRRDMAMRPGPLHDSVHPLARAARGLCLLKPDWPEYLRAIGRRHGVELTVSELRKHVGLKCADPLCGVLLVLPAGFQFFVNRARGLLEGERGGGNAGGLLFAVALVNGVFARG